MEKLAPLVARHPDVPVIVNHMGMPVASDPAGVDDWRQGMRALAANAHVVTKISGVGFIDRRRSEEHTSELQSLIRISYAVFCLKKKTKRTTKQTLSHSQQPSTTPKVTTCR